MAQAPATAHSHTTAHDVQEGLGETGRFGEAFIGLGLLILVGGVIEMVWANVADVGRVGHYDHNLVGFLYFIEGLGFLIFGAMVMLAGWGRHHANFEW